MSMVLHRSGQKRRLAMVLGAAVRDQIATDGHSVDWVQRLDAAGDAMAGAGFDVLLLHLMLTDDRGIPFLRRLRAKGDVTPVIILTALDQISDGIDGLNAGADDCKQPDFDGRARGAASTTSSSSASGGH